tara:strand:+ start:188 stop:505 length:318 start_codon:yes stop_codon:yes gene_type:complete
MHTEPNPSLSNTVTDNTELKTLLVNYVGEKLSPEDESVTVENIVEVMATEFPEFLLAVAEENWIRGYEQALTDVDEGQRLEREENNANSERVHNDQQQESQEDTN